MDCLKEINFVIYELYRLWRILQDGRILHQEHVILYNRQGSIIASVVPLKNRQDVSIPAIL